jgi:alanine transaminase
MKNLHESLKKRAEIVGSYLNTFEGITCNEVEGALYAFPKIDLP